MCFGKTEVGEKTNTVSDGPAAEGIEVACIEDGQADLKYLHYSVFSGASDYICIAVLSDI